MKLKIMSNAKEYKNSIKNWPKDERPGEKLFREGEHKLSNTELLAILLRSGIKGRSAIDLARKILQKFKTFRNMSHTDIRAWEEFKGLGQAKIAQIKVAIEIGRRFREEEIKDNPPKIKSSKDVVEIMMPRMRDLKKEIFKMLLLNSQNRVIEKIEITEGTVNQAIGFYEDVGRPTSHIEAEMSIPQTGLFELPFIPYPFFKSLGREIRSLFPFPKNFSS